MYSMTEIGLLLVAICCVILIFTTLNFYQNWKMVCNWYNKLIDKIDLLEEINEGQARTIKIMEKELQAISDLEDENE